VRFNIAAIVVMAIVAIIFNYKVTNLNCNLITNLTGNTSKTEITYKILIVLTYKNSHYDNGKC